MIQINWIRFRDKLAERSDHWFKVAKEQKDPELILLSLLLGELGLAINEALVTSDDHSEN